MIGKIQCLYFSIQPLFVDARADIRKKNLWFFERIEDQTISSLAERPPQHERVTYLGANPPILKS